MSGRRPRARIAAALVLAVSIGLATGATAETRRLETVAAVPLGPAAPAGVAPRDAAIFQAQRDAVSQIAQELLMEADAPPPGGDTGDLGDGEAGPDLEAVLGKNMVPYTSRFRILEDRGERPAMFDDRPEVETEYVLLVEVHVEVGRVRARLEEAGLLAPSAAPVSEGRIQLVVLGLGSWPAYSALREAALDRAGASRMVPIELEAGRAVFAVESEDPPREFLSRLLSSVPPALAVQSASAVPDGYELRVEWTPPPDSEADPGAAAAPAGSLRRN